MFVAVILFRLLPWEYAVRNLFRRPVRSGLTLAGLTTVITLVFLVVGFIRGLERSLAVSGDPQVAILFGLGMGENLEYSSIPARTADLAAASIPGVRRRYGRKYASAELFQGTMIKPEGVAAPARGLVRGVTPAALMVRSQVELVEGTWPAPGEVLVGRLAAAKLGVDNERLDVGNTVELEGRTWRISGRFSAGGSVFGAEIWCRLEDLQQAMKRQDLSLVAVTLEPAASFSEVNLFCKERLDLELQAIRETDYYATLQTIGFVRRAILLSVIQEGVLLAVTASLIASVLALTLLNGAAVRFTMGAFELRIDSTALLLGQGLGVLLGVLGAVPPSLRALRMQIVDGLKAV